MLCVDHPRRRYFMLEAADIGECGIHCAHFYGLFDLGFAEKV